MIKLTALRGLIPRIDSFNVPGQADCARDVNFEGGYPRPWRTPEQVGPAEGACSIFIHDGKYLTTDSDSTHWHVGEVCKRVFQADPCDCPRVYKDWCAENSIALGLPMPQPAQVSGGATEADDLTEYVAFNLQYCNENCPDCPVGPLSLPSNQIKCNKDDTITICIPPLPESKFEVTHVKIFRTVTTWDTAQGMHEAGTDGFVGNNPFGGFETAVDSACFEIDQIPVSNTETKITVTCELPCGEAPRCPRGFAPPEGMCIAGETTRGSLVGFHKDCILFSERHSYHAYPPAHYINLGCDVAAACTFNDNTFVITEDGQLYIIQDDITGAEDGECRTVRPIRKTARPAGGRLMASKQVLCDHTGFTWISDKGIMRATTDGAVVNITHPWFGYQEWLNALPSQMTLAKYRGALFFSSPAYSGVLDINADGDVVGDSVPNHSTLSICPKCWVSDCDDRLYFLSCDILWEFNIGAGCMCMKYRSAPVGVYGIYTTTRVDFLDGTRCCDSGAGTLCVIADGKTIDAVPVRGKNGYRHKRVRAHEMSFEYVGTKAIRGFCSAASLNGLALQL